MPATTAQTFQNPSVALIDVTRLQGVMQEGVCICVEYTEPAMSTGVVPEGHSAIRGHLHTIKAHDNVIRLEVLGRLIGWLDVAHQDALLLLLHAVGGTKGV